MQFVPYPYFTILYHGFTRFYGHYTLSSAVKTDLALYGLKDYVNAAFVNQIPD